MTLYSKTKTYLHNICSNNVSLITHRFPKTVTIFKSPLENVFHKIEKVETGLFNSSHVEHNLSTCFKTACLRLVIPRTVDPHFWRPSSFLLVLIWNFWTGDQLRGINVSVAVVALFKRVCVSSADCWVCKASFFLFYLSLRFNVVFSFLFWIYIKCVSVRKYTQKQCFENTN